MSYGNKTIIGTLWNVVASFGNQLTAFLIYILLARILSVEEFGLIAFSFIVLELGYLLTNFGVNQNLIQRDRWESSFVVTCFWFLLGLSLIVALFIALIVAPLSELLFMDGSGFMIASLAFVPILTGLSLVSSAELQRNFKTKKISLINLISTSIGGITSVSLALYGAGVWSVIFGKLLQSTITSICFVLAANFKPQLSYEKNHIQEIVSFGLPLLWLAILRFFSEKAIHFSVVLILGNVAFAFVSVAQRGQKMLSEVTMTPLNMMLVPSFSRVDDKNLCSAFYRVLSTASMIVIPMFLGFGAVADLFIDLTFGEKWEASASLISILVFSIFASLLGWFLPSILITKAHTKAAFHLGVINLAGSLCGAIVGASYSMTGAAVGITLFAFLTIPMRYKILNKYFNISLFLAIRKIMPATVSAILMFLSIYFLKQAEFNHSLNEFIQLIILICSGFLIYVTCMILLFNRQTMGVLTDIIQIRKQKT